MYIEIIDLSSSDKFNLFDLEGFTDQYPFELTIELAEKRVKGSCHFYSEVFISEKPSNTAVKAGNQRITFYGQYNYKKLVAFIEHEISIINCKIGVNLR